MTSRKLAFDAILKTFTNKGYSNLTLDALLNESNLQPKDKQFASRLFYGVLERKITLDYQIEVLTSKKVSKLDAEVLVALELGIYQLLYMDSVPDSASVNESVNIIKNSKKKSASGFVNGVLRSFIRNGKKVVLPKGKYESLEVEYSIPCWIIKKWEKDYSLEKAKLFAEAFLKETPLNIRVNTNLISTEALSKAFADSGVEFKAHRFIPDCLTLKHSGSVAKLYGFNKGYFYVQDASSQLSAIALSAKEGEKILDLCAAPGSKSFTVAQLTNDKAQILSFDLHPHRVNLIKEGAERLGLKSITALKGNATVFNRELINADRVLCDVPCSGLGIVGRKPEIKYKSEKEVENLKDIQLAILSNGAKYLKKGGVLVYSTCALSKDENENVVKEFLKNNPDFEKDNLPEIFEKIAGRKTSEITLSPLDGDFDGFFISRIRRK